MFCENATDAYSGSAETFTSLLQQYSLVKLKGYYFLAMNESGAFMEIEDMMCCYSYDLSIVTAESRFQNLNFAITSTTILKSNIKINALSLNAYHIKLPLGVVTSFSQHLTTFYNILPLA